MTTPHNHPPHDTHDHAQTDNHQTDHAHGNPFLIPFLLILVFAVIEFSGGIWTRSLALLGDAWHMFSDVFALGLAMYASHRTARARRLAKHSRAEIIASILNAALMVLVVIWIVIEAFDRLQHPYVVAGGYVMLIAFFGLVINLIVAQRLHHHAHHHGGKDNLNHRAALLHVMGDVLGSVAALVAGVVIYYTGWLAIDPLLSLVISVLLLLVTISLIKDIWLDLRGERRETEHEHPHHH